MNRVLVTGGNGFIGRHVCAELEQHGFRPVVFDNHCGGRHETIFGDIRDATQVTEAAAHVDAVMHLAGVLGTQETIENPHPAAEVNVGGGLNVLEAAVQYRLPVVYIAVGNHWMDNSYSITKTATERFCRMYRQERGLTVATVRAMNAYGPGQVPAAPFGPSKVRKIVPAFACRALRGMPVEVYGDGMQIMDLVHVTDVARSLVAALGRSGDFEAGSCVATSVLDVAERVIAAAGSDVAVEFLPMRPGEPERSTVLADPDRLIVRPVIGLDDGLAETVRWLDDWMASAKC